MSQQVRVISLTTVIFAALTGPAVAAPHGFNAAARSVAFTRAPRIQEIVGTGVRGVSDKEIIGTGVRGPISPNEIIGTG